uniref:Uncharacterized protein n=1 Tax=Panagrolaimus sp. JU765 TaxID=591449 RepID=A0AC34QY35_9BILA
MAESTIVKPDMIEKVFIERGGGKTTETFKDLCSLLGFMHKHGSKVKKIENNPENYPSLKALILKYGIVDPYMDDLCSLLGFMHKHGSKVKKIENNPENYPSLKGLVLKYGIIDPYMDGPNGITLQRLAAAFPLENLIAAMNVKPRSYLKDVDFSLPHHWLSIDGAASLIPKDGKYDPLVEIVPRSFIQDVDYTRPHHWLGIDGAASLIPKDRKYDPLVEIVVFYESRKRAVLLRRGESVFDQKSADYAQLCRQKNFSERRDKNKVEALIKAGIIDPTTKEIIFRFEISAKKLTVTY